MFGISIAELLLVLVLLLTVFKPEQLPQGARSFGKFMGGLKRNMNALRREFYNTVYTPTQPLRDDLKLATRELNTIGAEVEKKLFKQDPLCPDFQEGVESEVSSQTKAVDTLNQDDDKDKRDS